MNKTIIEKYINFAIANWYNPFTNIYGEKYLGVSTEQIRFTNSFWEKFCELDDDIEFNEVIEIWYNWVWIENNFIWFITSKEFIEAVMAWIIDKYCNNNIYDWSTILVKYWDFPYTWKQYDFGNNNASISSMMYDITIFQALAIRDDKLEEFINNILPNE